MAEITNDEFETLRAAANCTDEAGLPIMAREAEIVMSLERRGLARIAGTYANRLFILPAGLRVLIRSAA